MSTMLIRSEDVSYITSTGKLTQQLLLVNKFSEKSIKKEETHWSVSTLVLTLCMLLPEESSVHMFGNTVLKRLNTTLILISLTTSQSARKKKCKLKMKLIKSFLKGILSPNILRTKRLPNKSMVSTCIKEVSYRETQSELSTFTMSMLRLAVVLMPTIHHKSDG